MSKNKKPENPLIEGLEQVFDEIDKMVGKANLSAKGLETLSMLEEIAELTRMRAINLLKSIKDRELNIHDKRRNLCREIVKLHRENRPKVIILGKGYPEFLIKNGFIENPKKKVEDPVIKGNTVGSEGKTTHEGNRMSVFIKLSNNKIISFSYIYGDETSYRFEWRIKNPNNTLPPLVMS